MNFSSVGDLAQNLMLRRQSSNLSAQMDRLTRELVTGRQADTGNAVKGDFSVPASLQRSLSLSDAYSGTRKTVLSQLAAQQTALDRIADPTGDLGLRVIESLNSGNTANLDLSLKDAKGEFRNAVAALNTQFAGKSLFSGASPDRAAIADADTFLADLRTATAGATTAADFLSAVDDWFTAPGGGFETSGFLGSSASGDGTSIDDGVKIPPQITADDDAIRSVLRDLAVLSLAADGALSGDAGEVRTVIETTAERSIQSNADLINLRAEIGSREALVEQSNARAAAHRFALEKMQNDLTAIDPYTAATELEAARSSLEALYTVTSRTSQLSLTDYLR